MWKCLDFSWARGYTPARGGGARSKARVGRRFERSILRLFSLGQDLGFFSIDRHDRAT
jgi:hypothetical protein